MKLKYTLAALAALSTMSAQALPIKKSEAREIAQTFIDINDTTADDDTYCPYYIFSRGSGKGFVIVSGDDSTTPILGYTDQGDYLKGSMPEAFEQMLAQWANRIQQLQKTHTAGAKRMPQTPALIQRRLAAAASHPSWSSVSPLIVTHWHQSYPYNMLAPRRTDNNQQAMTGCEATAAAQIVYYFRRDNPSALLYATPTYSGSWFHAPVTMSLPAGTPVRYDLMKLSGTGTLQQDSAVAVLMYAVGTCARLGYGYQDGTATAGQTSDMGNSISSEFNLQNDYLYKGSYSQSGWEAMIYANLSSGRPLLYSGSNPTSGGHAVVLDGYQSSTGLFHFNFGWGGQGDGYYTVNDSTGMNGFSSDQAVLANITPKKQNIKGELSTNGLYTKAQSTIRAKIFNNSTLAYKGINLYCSNINLMPTTDPTASDNVSEIVPGDSLTIDFVYHPTSAKPLYIFLTDANKNLLDSMQVMVQTSKADLVLNSIKVDASGVTVNHEGQAYQQVNNTTVNVSVNLTNGPEGTYCQPYIRCHLDSLDQSTKEWKSVKTLSINKLIFEAGATRDTLFTYSSLEPERYYRAYMEKRVNAGVTSQMTFATADSVVYFVVAKPDFALTVNGRGAIATGHWNEALFNKAATDANVTSYDLTAVKDLNIQPVSANGNAVFYLSYRVPGTINTVVDGQCDSLVIHTSGEFLPTQAFTAKKAVLVLDSVRTGQWGEVVVPFAVSLPSGMQGRQVTAVGTTRLTMENVRSVSTMQPLLYLTDRDALHTLEASDVTITTDSVATAANGLWKGYTVTTTTGDGVSLLGETKGVPAYLAAEAGSRVAPFATQITGTYANGYRVYMSGRYASIDALYTALADTLNKAYQIMDEYGATAVQSLGDSVAKAESFFNNYEATGSQQVKDYITMLSNLMKQYLNQGVTDGISRVSVTKPETDDEAARTEYFSVDGRRLSHPVPGLVIVKRGSVVRKIWVR